MTGIRSQSVYQVSYARVLSGQVDNEFAGFPAYIIPAEPHAMRVNYLVTGLCRLTFGCIPSGLQSRHGVLGATNYSV